MAQRDARGHFIRATEGTPADAPADAEAAEDTAPRDVPPADPAKAEAKPKGRGGWPRGRARGPRRTPAPAGATAAAAKVTRGELVRSWGLLFATVNSAIGDAVGVEAAKLDPAEAQACGEAMATIMEVLGPVTAGKYVLLGQAAITIGGIEAAHVFAIRRELIARQAPGPRPLPGPVPVREQVTPVPGRPFPIGLASDGAPLRVDPSTLGPAPVPAPVGGVS